MFGRPPMDERIAQRQAELAPYRRGTSQFDYPVAKYVLIASLALLVAAHVIAGIWLAFL